MVRLLLLLPLFLVAACDGSSPRTYRCDGCNLVLISIDTLRADRLSAYGYSRPTSPNLERLAADGVLFESFFHSGGGTLPSHMSMMTSLNPMTHGIDTDTGRALEPERLTLAEQLKQAGYVTAAITDGGWMAAKFGFDQGFDLFDDHDVNGHFLVNLPKAYRWLDENRKRKFFLFLHTYDVHSQWQRLPYDCPAGYAHSYTAPSPTFDGCRDGKCASELLNGLNSAILDGRLTALQYFSRDEVDFISALYDGCINYADDRVGALLQYLKELSIYDETLVVLTSDHGEEFAEHGMLLHHQGGYEELSHIPLILKLPHSRLRSTRVTHLAAMIDLLPTILDILALPPIQQAQGRSLMPAVLDDRPTRRALHMFSALRTERWKYLSKSQQLYDLRDDPLEQHNAFVDHPDVVETLHSQISRLTTEDNQLFWQFRRHFNEGGDPLTLTEDEIENLKALGYLD